MFILSAILSISLSCNKMETPVITLVGNWGLEQTELYENGELKGATSNTEITTYYHFQPNGNGTSAGALKINDEGESEVLPYSFDRATLSLTIGDGSRYTIEKITDDALIFSKEYGTYKSRYKFNKVE